ncbi:MAG: hypothetical protein M1381_06870 [Deltaproteobacteria bacterium]|nr:hypothetical protein [Deltaproteobacteria bacterium]MCL5792971.1 hypothetical protein [Deltaproteobacteria bacterium]
MLKKNALGLSIGLVIGLFIFLLTNYIVLHHGGSTLIKLNQIYWGYTITFGGSLLGLIYGFVTGYIAGWLIAWFYNFFA